ncbi:carbohydrate ABC transporter membrane protein 1, CUT1 family [Jiangella alkaliphila]|uniref:Carbohydrate ABC transporter membrane protein 1, CUT1 family n=1 Tax=Jiangella alkaliphila TaxID=419479 RepID=A0A1H2I8M4_9ACTN|nr:carbohydrate ABC transporter membrane protein 1, CUT1 family [Jiangella alkaliphila]
MPRRTDTLARQESRLAFKLISPTLLIVLVVVVLPVIWTISLAFQDVRLINLRDAGFFGEYNLDNFATVFGSAGFWSSLWTTVVYTVGATLGSIVIGLIAALALRRPFRGRGVLRAAMLLPYVAPVVAATFVWSVALNPQFGIVNAWGTEFLGWDEPVPFLSQRDYSVGLFGVDVTVPLALLTVIAFEAWRYFPFAFLFIIARLQALPGELDEAAVVDGTSIWQRFRYITLPQLMPVIALLTILRFIFTFNKFDDVYLLTGGGAGTEVVSIRVYEFLTARTDIGAAAAQSLVLAAVLTVFIAVYMRTTAARGETS